MSVNGLSRFGEKLIAMHMSMPGSSIDPLSLV
jgi:hypothetical protein